MHRIIRMRDLLRMAIQADYYLPILLAFRKADQRKTNGRIVFSKTHWMKEDRAKSIANKLRFSMKSSITSHHTPWYDLNRMRDSPKKSGQAMWPFKRQIISQHRKKLNYNTICFFLGLPFAGFGQSVNHRRIQRDNQLLQETAFTTEA